VQPVLAGLPVYQGVLGMCWAPLLPPPPPPLLAAVLWLAVLLLQCLLLHWLRCWVLLLGAGVPMHAAARRCRWVVVACSVRAPRLLVCLGNTSESAVGWLDLLGPPPQGAGLKPRHAALLGLPGLHTGTFEGLGLGCLGSRLWWSLA